MRSTRVAAVGVFLAAAVVAGTLGACQPDKSPPPVDSGAPEQPAPPADPPPGDPPADPPGGAAAGRPDLSAGSVVANGIHGTPWGLAFLPGGDALVALRDTGAILRVPAAGGEPRQVQKLPSTAQGEGGLLGIAVSPGYAEDGWVYAYYTAATDNRIVRFKLGATTPTVLIDGIAKDTLHNGGRLAFGPDGMLYASTGDASDRSRSQDRASLNGKILRITPDGKVPADNPISGSYVYSLGHRNVQGLAFASDGRLFATEFGQNAIDEINLIEPAGNYGWPTVEGTGADRRFTNPLVTWKPAEASPSGLAIAGDTLYAAALRGRRLWTVPITAAGTGTPKAELAGEYGRLRTAAIAPDGALWITTSNRDGRGQPGGTDDRIIRFPARP